MRDNGVRSKLKRGDSVYGTIVMDSTSPAVPLVLAKAGFDFCFIDLEHGALNLELAANMISVARLANIMPLVRVATAEYPLIARALDMGAMGIMVPRVETCETVERCIAAMRYPPLGKRGCAPGRAHSDYDAVPAWELARHANENILSVIQIETGAAVERIDDLLSVPGVDVAFVGPTDLMLSLDAPGPDDPRMEEAIQKVVQAAARHHVASGIHLGDPHKWAAWQRRGMRMLSCQSDIDYIRQGARAALDVLNTPGTA